MSAQKISDQRREDIELGELVMLEEKEEEIEEELGNLRHAANGLKFYMRDEKMRSELELYYDTIELQLMGKLIEVATERLALVNELEGDNPNIAKIVSEQRETNRRREKNSNALHNFFMKYVKTDL